MKHIVSILLSVFLLLNSSGLAYAQHFCGGHKIADTISLGQKAFSCETSEENGFMMPADKPGCCENKYHEVETDENFAKSSFDFDLSIELVQTSSPAASFTEVPLLSAKQIIFSEYLPPPLEKDISIYFQVFLI